ncbi:MAG: M42 family metallopeptidase [Armatimonadota bacterium]|nr:M42 family metallopeptidase [Armatimonadota bacterium]
MKQASVDLLRTLTETNGVPGFESRIAAIMRQHLEEIAEISSDRLGSLIARVDGAAERPRIMLAGHMDEIGFMVKLITEDGFVKFSQLGGWWEQVLLAQRVVIETSKGPVSGLIGSKPPHLLEEEERKKVVQRKNMFIDVGAKDREDAAEGMGIRPGDPIVPDSPFQVLADGDRLMAKGWDDRVGVALAIETLQALHGSDHPNTLFGVGTVQEEVGLRGAETSADAVDPDVGIVLETAIAGDVPGISEDESDVKLGEGVTLYMLEGSAIPNHRLRDLAIDLCEERGLEYQLTVLERGGTDAGRIHMHSVGVPSLVLGVPTRHIHTHAGIISATDYQTTLRLTCALCETLDDETVASLTE